MTEYFVDATLGNDGAAGTSELVPWKSYEPKVNGAAKNAGDFFKGKRDELWRERVEPDVSGTSGNYVTYSDYGSGAKPLFKGSDLIAPWTLDGGDIWKADLTTEPNQVFFDGVLGTEEVAKVNLNAAREWFWEANVLYVYSTSDPDDAYTDPGIEASVRDECVLADVGIDYVRLLNLDCQHANGEAGANGAIRLRWGNAYWLIEACEASWNACKGIAITAAAPVDATDNLVLDCIAHDNASDGIYSNCNNQTFDSCTSYSNRGLFGSGFKILGSTVSGGTIQYCIAYSNEDNGIHIDGNIDEPDADQIGPITVQYNLCYDNGDCGIMLEKSDDGTAAQYNLCWDNDNAGISIEHGGDTVNIYNNVLFSNTSLQLGVDHERVEVHTHTNITAKNNIMDGDGAVKTLKMGPNVTEGSFDLDHNCHWNSSGIMIDWNGVTYTQVQFANFQVTESKEANGISQDPLFVDAANDNFHEQSTSPCRDAGEDVGLNRDFVGVFVPQGPAPDIGAYEFLLGVRGMRRKETIGLSQRVDLRGLPWGLT